MSNYLAHDDQQVLLKKYQQISDTVLEALDELEYWVDNEYVGSRANSSEDALQKEIKVILGAIAQFRLQDKKSQEIIKKAEQKLLDKWKERVE